MKPQVFSKFNQIKALFALTLVLIGITSCEKDSIDLSQNSVHTFFEMGYIERLNPNIINNTLQISPRYNPIIDSVYVYLREQNFNHHFAEKIITAYGYPIWGSLAILSDTMTNREMIGIPFITETDTLVTAMLVLLYENNEFSEQALYSKDSINYILQSTPNSSSWENISIDLILFDMLCKKVLGENHFANSSKNWIVDAYEVYGSLTSGSTIGRGSDGVWCEWICTYAVSNVSAKTGWYIIPGTGGGSSLEIFSDCLEWELFCWGPNNRGIPGFWSGNVPTGGGGGSGNTGTGLEDYFDCITNCGQLPDYPYVGLPGTVEYRTDKAKPNISQDIKTSDNGITRFGGDQCPDDVCDKIEEIRSCVPVLGTNNYLLAWFMYLDDVVQPGIFDDMVDIVCGLNLEPTLIEDALLAFKDLNLTLSWNDLEIELMAIEDLIEYGVEISSQEVQCLISTDNSASKLNNYLIANSYTSNSSMIQFGSDAIAVICSDPDIKMQRLIELNELIIDDEYSLISECAEENIILDLNDYFELFNFEISQSTETFISNNSQEGFAWQPISEGDVAVTNIDDYSVEITSLPDLDDDGFAESMQEVYDDFRENFILFSSGTSNNFDFNCAAAPTSDIYWEFQYFLPSSESLWLSSNPVNTVFKIETSAAATMVDLISDKGAVIVSQSTSCCFIASSITTNDTGTQPFSGNRQFGWRVNSNNRMEIYTKGIDVATRPYIFRNLIFKNCMAKDYYGIAFETWSNFQKVVEQFIEQYDGQATIQSPNQITENNETIIDLLKSNTPITFIPCE